MKNQLLPICFLLFCFSIYQEAKAKFELKNVGNIQSYAMAKPLNTAAFKHDLNDNVTVHDYAANHAILAYKMVFFQWLGIICLTILCLLLWRELIIIRRKKEMQKNELVFCRKETALLDEKSNVLEVNNQIHQKVIDELTKKDQTINSAMRYAHSLQLAILSPQKIISGYFDNSFVLFQPKDILSGDFFHFEKVGPYHIIAVCDCTGHGIPAAMLTLICKKALTHAILSGVPEKPGSILDLCRKEVRADLSATGDYLREGMDMGICLINFETGQLFFAGANRPLLIARNGVLQEIKGNHMPIGHYEREEPFTHSELILEKGNRLYLFSDGIHDQFGGAHDKKWKKIGFYQLLAEIQSLPFNRHKVLIKEGLMGWKKETEQTDDVLLVGLEY